MPVHFVENIIIISIISFVINEFEGARGNTYSRNHCSFHLHSFPAECDDDDSACAGCLLSEDSRRRDD